MVPYPEDPGLPSYHLRQLAESGYIEEAPELGRDGRERWWRAVPGGVRWSPADFQSPGSRAALASAQQVLTARQLKRLHVWQMQGSERWGMQWAAAAVATDAVLRLSPEELRQFGAELDVLISKWAERSRQLGGKQRSPSADDREQVFVFAHAFPFSDGPGSVSGQTSGSVPDHRVPS